MSSNISRLLQNFKASACAKQCLNLLTLTPDNENDKRLFMQLRNHDVSMMLRVYLALCIATSLVGITVHSQSVHNLVWEIINKVVSIVLIVVTILLSRKAEDYTYLFVMINYLLIQVLAYFIHHQVMEVPEGEDSFVRLYGYLDATFNFVIHSLILCPDFKNMIVYMLSAVGLIIEVVVTKDLESTFWQELLVVLLFEFLFQGPTVYYILQRKELQRFYENQRRIRQ